MESPAGGFHNKICPTLAVVGQAFAKYHRPSERGRIPRRVKEITRELTCSRFLDEVGEPIRPVLLPGEPERPERGPVRFSGIASQVREPMDPFRSQLGQPPLKDAYFNTSTLSPIED